MLITLLEVLFYYYPSLLTTTLSLFACFHIDPSGSANSQYHNAQVCASLYVLYTYSIYLAYGPVRNMHLRSGKQLWYAAACSPCLTICLVKMFNLCILCALVG